MAKRIQKAEDLERFDREYDIFLSNRAKYKGIYPKQENNSWQVGSIKPSKTVRSLAEALAVRDANV